MSDDHRSFPQHKIQLMACQLDSKMFFFPFPLIFEIIIDVKHYIENNVGFILHGFAKKL